MDLVGFSLVEIWPHHKKNIKGQLQKKGGVATGFKHIGRGVEASMHSSNL